MTAQTITIVGARGGSGTSTIASAVALHASRVGRTELVTSDVGSAAALLGLGASPDPSAPMDVVHGLTLVSAATGTAPVSVIDAGRLDQLDDRPTGPLLVALRGPCYLGLRSIVTRELHPDGIVVLSETGRSLTVRDVQDVCGVPVVAQVHITANVARTIDAGLLVARSHALRELAGLHQYVDTIVSVTNPVAVSRSRHPSTRSQQPSPAAFPSPATVSSHLDPATRKTRPKIGTDMPVALCATSRPRCVLSRSRVCTRHSLLEGHRRRDCVEHREVGFGSERVLRR
ncbi:MAG: hypothetical protein M3Q30_21220 [Actinomycetota bacterium]|nr:hypothetical protein [Actinomycetota bacterium]